MDPALKNRVTTALKDQMMTLPRGLRRAAKYLLDHPAEFGMDSIRATASKAGVSTYTLVRLAERLGFAGYDELRAPFRQALLSAGLATQPLWVEDLRAGDDLARIQAESALNEMAIVQRSLQQLKPEHLQRVVMLMSGASTVYVTGMRASHALASYFHYVGQMALPSLQLIPRPMTTAIDDLHTARPGDVLFAITFTPCSRETIDACAFARQKGLTLILLSDSEIVSTEFQPDETLIASVVSTYHFGCLAGAMAILETLIAALVAHGGQDAQARIASYDTLRRERQAYWAPAKKR